VERETGFEPATSTLARSHSTTELFPLNENYGTTSGHGRSSRQSQLREPEVRQSTSSIHPERLPEHLNPLRFSGRPRDGHHVKTAWRPVQVVPGHVVRRHGGNPPLLPTRHGFGRVAASVVDPGLHLHEHDCGAIPGDDVNFANSSAVAPGKNCVPSTHELFARAIFRAFPECNGFRAPHTRTQGQDASQHGTRATDYNDMFA
jgi:hypothetical protein